MNKLRIGDKVQVITGKDKGKIGTIIFKADDRIKIEGVKILVKHAKGGITTSEGVIHSSNVMHFDQTNKQASKISIDPQTKARIYKKSGQIVPNNNKRIKQ